MNAKKDKNLRLELCKQILDGAYSIMPSAIAESLKSAAPKLGRQVFHPSHEPTDKGIPAASPTNGFERHSPSELAARNAALLPGRSIFRGAESNLLASMRILASAAVERLESEYGRMFNTDKSMVEYALSARQVKGVCSYKEEAANSPAVGGQSPLLLNGAPSELLPKHLRLLRDEYVSMHSTRETLPPLDAECETLRRRYLSAIHSLFDHEFHNALSQRARFTCAKEKFGLEPDILYLGAGLSMADRLLLVQRAKKIPALERAIKDSERIYSGHLPLMPARYADYDEIVASDIMQKAESVQGPLKFEVVGYGISDKCAALLVDGGTEAGIGADGKGIKASSLSSSKRMTMPLCTFSGGKPSDASSITEWKMLRDRDHFKFDATVFYGRSSDPRDWTTSEELSALEDLLSAEAALNEARASRSPAAQELSSKFRQAQSRFMQSAWKLSSGPKGYIAFTYADGLGRQQKAFAKCEDGMAQAFVDIPGKGKAKLELPGQFSWELAQSSRSPLADLMQKMSDYATLSVRPCAPGLSPSLPQSSSISPGAQPEIPKLADCGVEFNEEEHTYFLGGRQLMGITGLIHEVTGVGQYPSADPKVEEFYIPRAAEYGHAVHHAIEMYDKTGERITSYPRSERFIDRSGSTWEVDRELDSYLRNQKGFVPVANEYPVTDFERYASCIDNVWMKVDTGGIWLIDTKTNNLDLYPGGQAGLEEYLSWQLSVYARRFEEQNPGLKVEGMASNWLRRSESKFLMIERKPDEMVDRLLATDWRFEDGKVVYDREGWLQREEEAAQRAKFAQQCVEQHQDEKTLAFPSGDSYEISYDENSLSMSAGYRTGSGRFVPVCEITANPAATFEMNKSELQKKIMGIYPELGVEPAPQQSSYAR